MFVRCRYRYLDPTAARRHRFRRADGFMSVGQNWGTLVDQRKRKRIDAPCPNRHMVNLLGWVGLQVVTALIREGALEMLRVR